MGSPEAAGVREGGPGGQGGAMGVPSSCPLWLPLPHLPWTQKLSMFPKRTHLPAPTCLTHLPHAFALLWVPFHPYSTFPTFPGPAQTPSSPQLPPTSPELDPLVHFYITPGTPVRILNNLRYNLDSFPFHMLVRAHVLQSSFPDI